MIDQILSSLIGKLVADEFAASAPGISGKILKLAVSRVPQLLQHRLAEEWASHLEATPGTIRKLCEATGFFFAARSVAAHKQAHLDKLIAEAKEKIGPSISVWMREAVAQNMVGPNSLPEVRELLVTKLNENFSNIDRASKSFLTLVDWGTLVLQRCNEGATTNNFSEAANKLVENTIYAILEAKAQIAVEH